MNRLTQYEWCLCGASQKLTDPAGNATAWDWNISGQNLSKTYADGRTYTHNYDSAGRLLTTLDPKGQTTRYTYANDNSISSKNYDNALVATPSVSYAYDPFYPRLSSWTDALGTTTNTYFPSDGVTNGAGKIASVDGPWANDTMTYQYDSQGRPAGYTLPGGGESMTYDLLNRPASLTSVMGTTTFSYQGATERVLAAIPTAGPKTLFTYGTAAEDFRLKQISNQSAAGALISQHDYTYSKDGQILTWQRSFDAASALPAQSYQFSYDLADRLTGGRLKTTTSGTLLKDHQFIQDVADNKLSIREGTKLKSGTYNVVNQQLGENPGGKVRITGAINKPDASVTLAGTPVAVHPQGGFAVEIDAAQGSNHFPLVVTEANGTVTTKFVDLQVENAVPMIHSYDLNGNLQSVAPQAAPSAPVRTYQWDAANRLVGITRIISNTVTRKTELLYNGMGSRVGKTERLNGEVLSDSKTIYGETGVLQERSADGGTVLKTYAPHGEMDSTNGTAVPRYYTRDHLGSVWEVVASDGSVLARYDYTPYGERSRVSGTYEAPKGYTGHDYHADGGLILTRYRAYDPLTGRWLSADPIEERGGLNLYGYVDGDPVSKIDPTGEFAIPIFIVAASVAIVFAIVSYKNFIKKANDYTKCNNSALEDDLKLLKNKNHKINKNVYGDLRKSAKELQLESASGVVGQMVPGHSCNVKGPVGKVINDTVDILQGVANDHTYNPALPAI